MVWITFLKYGFILLLMNSFVFLYPIQEIIDFEINQGMYMVRDEEKDKKFILDLKGAKSEEEENIIRRKALQEVRAEFRSDYGTILNKCIDLRYRQKGFGINYVVFDGSPVSGLIEFQEADRIINAGLDFKTHTTKQADGRYLYPNSDYILAQLKGTTVIRIAGFHMWDCVEKLARRAYETGLDALVDEDLTEFFTIRFKSPGFELDKYPTYKAGKNKRFLQARKGKPWLWQDY